MREWDDETDVQWRVEHGVPCLEFGDGSCDGEVWADPAGLVITASMDGGYHPQGFVIPWDVLAVMRDTAIAPRRCDVTDYVRATGEQDHYKEQLRPDDGCLYCPGGSWHDERTGPPEPTERAGRAAHEHTIVVDPPRTVVGLPSVASR